MNRKMRVRDERQGQSMRSGGARAPWEKNGRRLMRRTDGRGRMGVIQYRVSVIPLVGSPSLTLLDPRRCCCPLLRCCPFPLHSADLIEQAEINKISLFQINSNLNFKCVSKLTGTDGLGMSMNACRRPIGLTGTLTETLMTISVLIA